MSKRNSIELTPARLKSTLDYSEETGEFRWKKDIGSRAKLGALTGYKNCNGYLEIRVDGTLYRAHRLAWFYVYGEWPLKDIDHINGSKADNRISNLRQATNAENHQNMGSRNLTIGTSWHKLCGKWRASISVNGKSIHLGLFDSQAEAHKRYCSEKQSLHKFNPTQRA